MKKSIKADLVSLAHKILQLKEGSDFQDLAKMARELHEQLTVLAFAEKMEKYGQATVSIDEVEGAISTFQGAIPKGSSDTKAALNDDPLKTQDSVTDTPKIEKGGARTIAEIADANTAMYNKVRGGDKHRPDGTEFNQDEALHEPVIEKIKDMVAEMPPEAAEIDAIFESIEPKSFLKNDAETIGNEYRQTPIFEAVETKNSHDLSRTKNQSGKAGLKIGLNDRIAFIKHLFEGKTDDYNRVLSQLNTFKSSEQAKNFILKMVKPDYNWDKKEKHEDRLLQIIDNGYV